MSLGPYLPLRWAVTTPDLAGLSNVWPLTAGQNFIKKRTFSWSTGVQTSVSGRELRNGNYSAPFHAWEVSLEFLRKKTSINEWAQIVAFVMAQQGQFIAWYYFDPTDNAVSNQYFGTGDGTSTAFQLERTVQASSTSAAFTEPVYALNGTPLVYVNGTATTAFSVNSYGVLIFTTAPAASAVLTWTGSFLFVCRFTSDDLDLAQDYSKIWSSQSITWKSLKP